MEQNVVFDNKKEEEKELVWLNLNLNNLSFIIFCHYYLISFITKMGKVIRNSKKAEK